MPNPAISPQPCECLSVSQSPPWPGISSTPTSPLVSSSCQTCSFFLGHSFFVSSFVTERVSSLFCAFFIASTRNLCSFSFVSAVVPHLDPAKLHPAAAAATPCPRHHSFAASPRLTHAFVLSRPEGVPESSSLAELQ